jgi:hypothetical protein
MAVPTQFSELSTTAASNPPADTEGVSQGDDQFRAVYSFIRYLYEGSTNGQIAFPAVQNASAVANTLDDYEEGSWTPSSANVTYTTAVGRYIKIGRAVFVSAHVVFPVTANSADAGVQGLPFQAENVTNSYGIGAIAYTDCADARQAVISPNTATIAITNGSGNGTTNAQLSAKTLTVGAFYFATA